MGLGATRGPLQMDWTASYQGLGLGRQAEAHPGYGVQYAGVKVASVPTDILGAAGGPMLAAWFREVLISTCWRKWLGASFGRGVPSCATRQPSVSDPTDFPSDQGLIHPAHRDV